jgi:hypothetical protein
MAVIFDLDGTLIKKGVQPNPKMIALCNNTPDAYIITGRPEKDRAVTVQLLRKYGIRYKKLLMNTMTNDAMGQIQSKRMNAQHVMQQAGNVTMAVDDDPAARILYQKIGISNVTGP